MLRADAAEMSLLHVIQKREDKEKADAWWMDDGTRTFLFKCMQLESSAVLTIDRDNHEHMTCRQVRDAQLRLTCMHTSSFRRHPNLMVHCPQQMQMLTSAHRVLCSWQSCRQCVWASTGGAT